MILSNEELNLQTARKGVYYKQEGTEQLPLWEAFASVPAQEYFLVAAAVEWYTRSPKYTIGTTPIYF